MLLTNTSSVEGMRPAVSGVQRLKKRQRGNNKAAKKTLAFFINKGFWYYQFKAFLL